MNSETNTKLLLTILVIVIIGAFLFKFLKQEEYTYYTQARGEARFNHFYAAQLLVEKYGITASSISRVKNQEFLHDNKPFVLLVSSIKIFQQPVLLNRIIEWVVDGGILLMPVNIYSDRNLSDYISELDVKAELIKDSDKNENIIRYKNKFDISMSHRSVLETSLEPDWALQDEHGMHAIALPYQKGQIILFNSLRPFENTHIMEHDHASVFLNIIQKTGATHLKHIIYPDTPGLFAILSRYPLQLALFFSIIFFYIWKIWGYFGHVRNNTLYDQQHFKEHLEFSGQYLWRNVEIEKLYSLLIKDVEGKVIAREPDWNLKSGQEKISILSSLVQLDEDDMREVLFNKPGKDKHRFLSFTRNIIKIRNAI